MYIKLFRPVFTFCGALCGYGVSYLLLYVVMPPIDWWANLQMIAWEKAIFSIVCILLFAIIFFLIAPFLARRIKKASSEIEIEMQKVPAAELGPALIGLIAGLFVAFLISNLYSVIDVPYLALILSILTYFFLGYVGLMVARKRGKDLFTGLSQLQKRPLGGKNKVQEAAPKILDTSVIIDGRISDIMRTGFIEGRIIIPEFVLLELQHIADSSDSLKRNRGRRGLDILNRIQKDHGIEIYNTTQEKGLDEIPEVDIKLLKLAQSMNGQVVTNDYNLNKVAAIKGVKVLNINELANTLKPVVLPGEEMTVFLVKEGKEHNQGVAYLDDGTMIVVEEGRPFIGKTVDLTVTSVLQTSAGRMIFGKPKK
ncbi:MAG: PIN/TRAM domain-containing protein [Firmicutes bacterium]|nr:PIN/TRAM domain-containing protein [Bacillota bacterium]